MLTDLTPSTKDTVWHTVLKRKSNNLLFTGDPSHQQKQALA
jgi:hypothetical protein